LGISYILTLGFYRISKKISVSCIILNLLLPDNTQVRSLPHLDTSCETPWSVGFAKVSRPWYQGCEQVSVGLPELVFLWSEMEFFTLKPVNKRLRTKIMFLGKSILGFSTQLIHSSLSLYYIYWDMVQFDNHFTKGLVSNWAQCPAKRSLSRFWSSSFSWIMLPDESSLVW
jgi:hypothetical protein